MTDIYVRHALAYSNHMSMAYLAITKEQPNYIRGFAANIQWVTCACDTTSGCMSSNNKCLVDAQHQQSHAMKWSATRTIIEEVRLAIVFHTTPPILQSTQHAKSVAALVRQHCQLIPLQRAALKGSIGERIAVEAPACAEGQAIIQCKPPMHRFHPPAFPRFGAWFRFSGLGDVPERSFSPLLSGLVHPSLISGLPGKGHLTGVVGHRLI